MKGWKTVQKMQAVPMAEVMKEQQIEQDLATAGEDAVDQDYLFAMQLHDELTDEVPAGEVYSVADDEMIARMLQENESQLQYERDRPAPSDTAAFSKVKVRKSDWQSLDTSNPNHKPVYSSSYQAALQLKRKIDLNHLNPGTASKHEPLLRALRTSEHLTEIDGGGDLAGLLVDRNVGRPLEEFAKKQRKAKNRKGSTSGKNNKSSVSADAGVELDVT